LSFHQNKETFDLKTLKVGIPDKKQIDKENTLDLVGDFCLLLVHDKGNFSVVSDLSLITDKSYRQYHV